MVVIWNYFFQTVTFMVILGEFLNREHKIGKILPENQHSHRKLLNFENWCNGGVSKIYFQSQFSMSKIIGIFPDFFFVEEYQLRSTFLIYLTSVLNNFIFFLSVISHNVTGTAERQISWGRTH